MSAPGSLPRKLRPNLTVDSDAATSTSPASQVTKETVVTLDRDSLAVDVRSDGSDFSPKQDIPDMTSFSHGVILPGSIMDNQAILTDEEIGLATLLQEAGQGHLMAGWGMPGKDDERKHGFFRQIMQLNETCPGDGGLIGYCERARRLLADSYEGVNSLQGWTPGIPVGKALQPGSASYAELEGLGAPELGSCGFVLVAGGLGERLGYRDIKLKLPTDLCSGTCYLELYCKQILALEAKHGSGRKVPLAIMVSDDTQEGTVSLLQKQGFFGLDPLQVHFMKQNKVPSILDNDGRIALQPGDLYKIMTKPHGHGDIHSLMHETGTAKKWLDAGVKWVVFLQDTNGLAMHTLAATIGVSVKLGLDMNSLAIPRKAKQAVGGIVKLKHTETGREMTINVEYNQLDSLTGSGFDQGDTNDPSTGFSPYPGNINQLVFALKPYVSVLSVTKGILPEFVNPKYSDEARSMFKPTRLECMMQDYPKILGPDAKVGFTSAPSWCCFSPVKNSLEEASKAVAKNTPAACAASGEADQYFVMAEFLRALGCKVEKAAPQTWLGISIALGPLLSFDPSFGIGLSDLQERFPTPEKVSISSRSALIIRGTGDVIIEELHLDGALVIDAPAGTSIRIQKYTASNAGWEMVAVPESALAAAPEVIRMRGYTLDKKDQAILKATSGSTVVNE